MRSRINLQLLGHDYSYYNGYLYDDRYKQQSLQPQAVMQVAVQQVQAQPAEPILFEEKPQNAAVDRPPVSARPVAPTELSKTELIIEQAASSVAPNTSYPDVSDLKSGFISTVQFIVFISYSQQTHLTATSKCEARFDRIFQNWSKSCTSSGTW